MSEKAKILFVDDEPQILVSLRALFRAKYQVFIANSGEQALEIVKAEHIHAVISDQRMPGMLGHEVLSRIKHISPNTMRLLLTGYSDLKAIMASINEGEVFRFINKPWDNAELRRIVDSAVHIAQNTMGSIRLDEFPAAEQIESQPQQTAGSAILVMDDAADTLAKVRQLYAAKNPVIAAETIDHAVQLLGSSDVAVVVCDIAIKQQDTTEFVKVLKQQYPLIMTIILTEAIDAEVAVELINQGQIFRYISKPLNADALEQSLRHAFWIYQRNKEKPQLLQRHKVEPVADKRDSSLIDKLFSSLKLLRNRMSFGT